jgi:cytoskeletal protein RodZ
MTLTDLYTELRTAREARGMSLDDIAQSTLINIDFLRAIEAGNTDILPAAYVRAFLRAYATTVGLDPSYVMHRFEGKTGTPPPTPPVQPQAIAHNPPEDSTSSFLARSSVRTWGVTLAVVFGVAAIIYLTQYESPAPARNPEVPIGTILKETERRLMPKDTAAAAPVTQPGSSRDSLVLHATILDTVWIQIAIDANPPADYLFPPGSRRQWKARDRFIVTLGNAGGVQFHLNARDLGALGKRGAVLRDVELTRESLTSPVQTETRP